VETTSGREGHLGKGQNSTRNENTYFEVGKGEGVMPYYREGKSGREGYLGKVQNISVCAYGYESGNKMGRGVGGVMLHAVGQINQAGKGTWA